jgi:hypothetical protein
MMRSIAKPMVGVAGDATPYQPLRVFRVISSTMKPEWEFLTKTIYDPEVFWVMVTAVATIFLVFLAAIPLRSLAKTRRTELARRLRDDFSTDRTRAIIFLIDHNLLDYDTEIPCFRFGKIRGDPAEDFVTQILGESEVLSIFEVDDTILNPLEEVAVLAIAKSVNLEDAYALFGNVVQSTIQNEAIQKHVRDVRSCEGSAKAWINLERIVPSLDQLDKKLSRTVARRK